MKKFSVKDIVAVGIGAALFFVLGRFVSIPSPVPNTQISVQYGFLGFLSVVYGPVVGFLAGFIGHTLKDLSEGGAWWSWIVASGVFGGCVGLLGSITRVDPVELGKGGLIKFNLIQAAAHVVCWAGVAPVLDIWWYSEPIEKLFAQGLTAAIANIITTAIVGSLLLVVYAATKPKAGSLTKE